jgi:hypothetical protein
MIDALRAVLLYRVDLIDYESEVLGPYELPEDRDEMPAFIRSLRETMVDRLAQRRGGGPPAFRRGEGKTEGLPSKSA